MSPHRSIFRITAAGALVGGALAVALTGIDGSPASASGGAVLIPTTADAQLIVAASPPGTTFVIASGTHADFHVVPKDGDTFVGQPGAVLDGMGSTTDAFAAFSSPSGPADDNVTIQGAGPSALLAVQGYSEGGNQQLGAVHPLIGTPSGDRYGAGWTLRWLEVADNYSRGLTTADGMTIDGCWVHDNGLLGIGGNGSSIQVLNSVISHNDTTANITYGEFGGVKISGANGLVLKGDSILGNIGPGVWTDRDATNVLITGDTIAGNTEAGARIEISHGVSVTANQVLDNGGVGPTAWLNRAGIVISTSSDVTISGNHLSGNDNGITAVEQDRGTTAGGTLRVLGDISVHDNTVTGAGVTGVAEDNGDLGVFSRNISFVHDSYQGNSRFSWENRRLTWAQWQGYGQDVTGSYTG